MIVGLTGGIAAGKSTALRIFSDLGLNCFDTDLMVHELYQESDELRGMIAERWNISLDEDMPTFRRMVADVVFRDRSELSWLESVIHPLVVKKIKELGDNYDLSICAVPLLFEAELADLFDVIVTISCDKDVQKRRLSERGWSKEDIEGRLSRQFSMEKKEELADYVISNIGDLEFFKRQCQILIEDWKQFPVKN